MSLLSSSFTTRSIQAIYDSAPASERAVVKDDLRIVESMLRTVRHSAVTGEQARQARIDTNDILDRLYRKIGDRARLAVGELRILLEKEERYARLRESDRRGTAWQILQYLMSFGSGEDLPRLKEQRSHFAQDLILYGEVLRAISARVIAEFEDLDSERMHTLVEYHRVVLILESSPQDTTARDEFATLSARLDMIEAKERRYREYVSSASDLSTGPDSTGEASA